jgi:hypothetical protein
MAFYITSLLKNVDWAPAWHILMEPGPVPRKYLPQKIPLNGLLSLPLISDPMFVVASLIDKVIFKWQNSSLI